MRILRESTLDEFARSVYEREKLKNPKGLEDWKMINNRGADPVQLLSRPKEQGGHPYKMPAQENRIVRIAALYQEEVESLLIHEYMLCEHAESGRWIRERVQVPKPKTRVLSKLAN